MWKAITYVSSGVTLVAFVVAVSAWLYREKLLQSERLIRTAPEDSRANLVERALEFFPVDTSDLSEHRKTTLALEQIRARAMRFRMTALVVVLVALLAACVVVFAIAHISNDVRPSKTEPTSEKPPAASNDVHPPKTESTGEKPPAASNNDVRPSKTESTTNRLPVAPHLSIVDVFTPTANTVEFKLKNSGNDTAFLKSVRFVFEGISIGCRDCMTEIAFVYKVRASIKDNVVTIKPNYHVSESVKHLEGGGAYTYLSDPSPPIRISESVPPRGVDAFRVAFDFSDQDTVFIGHWAVRAYALINFDTGGQIKTPYFTLSPTAASTRDRNWVPVPAPSDKR